MVVPVAPVGSLVLVAVVDGAAVDGAPLLVGARLVVGAAGREVVDAAERLPPLAVPELGDRCPLSRSTATNRARNTSSTAAARAVGPGRNLTSLED